MSTIAFRIMVGLCVSVSVARADNPPLAIDWKDGWLSIRHSQLPDAHIQVGYIESYCRPGAEKLLARYERDFPEHRQKQ